MSGNFSSKDVFALRKAGKLDEAYRMALKLNADTNPDEWDRRALAWCLVSLIKRDFDAGNTQRLEQYRHQLEKMTFDANEDEALFSQRKYALSLAGRISEGGAEALITSQKVFALRKTEKLDEAYQMALKLNARSNPDEWDRKALAWCLVDLIKREFSADNPQALEQYRQQLEKIKCDSTTDEVLSDQREKALLLCDPSAPITSQAQSYSKQQDYAKAIACYNKIYQNMPVAYHESFGWDLYKYSQQLYKEERPKIPQIKNNLNQYVKLQVTKPCRLHSAFLRLAAEMAKDDQLDLYVFLNLWGESNFGIEDFQRYRKEGSNTEYPSLFESVIQRISKAAVQNKKVDRMQAILPFLDDAIRRYEDNLWLTSYKAKILLGLERLEEAKNYCRAVCKVKLNEPWAWQLLGDAYADDPKSALSCYCKALLCPSLDKAPANLRYKLAEILAELGYYEQAKFEINAYLVANPGGGSIDLNPLTSQTWFKDTSPTASNTAFYQANKGIGEELLLSDLPWIDASLGDKFTKPGKDGKAERAYRHLYLKATPFALEQSCPEKKFSFHGLKDGDPIKIKGGDDPNDRFQIYSVTRRDGGQPWDIFSELVGVVVFVNSEKQVYNIIIKRDVESFIHIDKVKGELREGSFVEVAICQYHSEQGKKYRIISIKPTDKNPDPEIYKEFSDTVTIPDNIEVGFTSYDIFIPSHIVRSERLTNGDCISGDAVLSYNKKKSKWGWKAISVKKICSAKDRDYEEYAEEYADEYSEDNYTRMLKTPKQWIEYIIEQEQHEEFVHAEVPSELKTSEFYLEAVRQWGHALKYVPENLKTPELCLAAVQNDGLALRFLFDELKTPKLCRIAVQQNNHARQFLPDALKSFTAP